MDRTAEAGVNIRSNMLDARNKNARLITKQSQI